MRPRHLIIWAAAAPLLAGGRAPPPVTAVIIDPRPDLLYWAVRHAREALDANIPIVAFTKNATAFAARPDVRRLGNVAVKKCKDDTKKAYNKRLRDAVFWATLQTTHALLFEGDSWFEARPSFPLPYFLSKMDAGGYTMLGAPWDPARPFCQNDAEHCVGNSGASLWHVPRLMDALRDADRLVPSGGERGNVDRFVHRLLRRGNRTVAPAALAARWAEADVASPGVPFARHKPRQMTCGVCFVHLVGDGPFAPPSLTGARTCLVTDAPDAAPAGVDDVVRVGDLRQRFAAVGMPRHALARLVAYEAPPYALTLFPVGAARPSPEWWATLPSNADVLLDGGAVLLRRSAFARVWATALGAYVRTNAADPFGAALRDLTRSPGARAGALPALKTGIRRPSKIATLRQRTALGRSRGPRGGSGRSASARGRCRASRGAAPSPGRRGSGWLCRPAPRRRRSRRSRRRRRRSPRRSARRRRRALNSTPAAATGRLSGGLGPGLID